MSLRVTVTMRSELFEPRFRTLNLSLFCYGYSISPLTSPLDKPLTPTLPSSSPLAPPCCRIWSRPTQPPRRPTPENLRFLRDHYRTTLCHWSPYRWTTSQRMCHHTTTTTSQCSTPFPLHTSERPRGTTNRLNRARGVLWGRPTPPQEICLTPCSTQATHRPIKSSPPESSV